MTSLLVNIRTSRKVPIGSITIGGNSPIAIQSMTNTKTEDIKTTLKQVNELIEAGCDIVRLSVPNKEAVQSFSALRKQVRIPLVADIHFDYQLALAAIEAGADKIRINPGNIGKDENLYKIIKAAQSAKCAIRIGVNSGSAGKTAPGLSRENQIVQLALSYIHKIEQTGFQNIVISVKSSHVLEMITCNQLLAKACNYPLHIGVTEAGTVLRGQIKSAIGIGALLAQGIGDTIRVSLTADPVLEVQAAKDILSALEIQTYGVNVISCPTCSRTSIDVISLTEKVENYFRHDKRHLTIAVMGCEVNGPGEASHADFGIAAGKGEGLLFAHGTIVKKVNEAELFQALIELVGEGLN